MNETIKLMYVIGDSLMELMGIYKFTESAYKVKWLYNYWEGLMSGQQVDYFHWFISCVAYENVDDAYARLSVVRSE